MAELKDVMGAMLGASTAVAGFGLAFLGVVVALLQMTSVDASVKPALRQLSNFSIIAFLAAVLSACFGLAWLIDAATGHNVGALYWTSIATFAVSILSYFGILAVFLWLLPHTGVFNALASRLLRMSP